MINKETIKRIVEDTAYESSTLVRVGLVGSFSRGDFSDKSDIDLVFDTTENTIDEAVLAVGEKLNT